jgi:2-polyprenyl-3-methyl-5-hydroxy-6-metoxy-1,4-benzoquinol methylase
MSTHTQMPVAAPDIETSSMDYARRFAGKAGGYLLEAQARAVRAALRDLPPGSALDVGGGHGQLVDPLRRLGWSVTVQGTDEICCRNLRDLHGKRDCDFVRSDLHALPFEDRSFDLVIAVRLISHVDEWPLLLQEMCRVARVAVVIDYPSKTAVNVLVPLLFGLKRLLEGNTRRYISFWRRELVEQLAAHGFRATAEIKQLCLPMALHRLTRAAAPMRGAEAALRSIGMTRLIGSPVILRADRNPVAMPGV